MSIAAALRAQTDAHGPPGPLAETFRTGFVLGFLLYRYRSVGSACLPAVFVVWTCRLCLFAAHECLAHFCDRAYGCNASG